MNILHHNRFYAFVYRLIAFLAITALFACVPPLPEEEAPKIPVAKAVAPARKPPVVKPIPEKTETKPEGAFLEEEKKQDDFAPATHITGGDEKEQKIPLDDKDFAPATKIGEAAKSTTVKVGLLIPMSGDSVELGKSLLDAAVLAVYDKYSGLSSRETTARIELLPKDTGDTIEAAEKAAQDVLQEGAEIILGPLFSKQVSAVASIAKVKKVPVITFSNNISVAGDNVYLFGFIPEQQVTRIVQYYLNRKNNNIAALVPSNPYGAAIVKQLSAEVRKKGGRAHPIEYYSEDMSALDKNVGRLSRFLQEDTTKGQSLFIAEGGEKLKILTDTLAGNGINSQNIQFLGTGLWDDPETQKLPNLYGAWFASSPPERYQEFEKHFFATYAYKPERRASLSYDATALIINLALGSSGKGFPKEMILDQVGFNGPANGIFRFHDDGTIERGLSILMITGTGFKTVEPAPTTFNE